MGLGGDVLCWMEETGFHGSFMDAWEAYGYGDDVPFSQGGVYDSGEDGSYDSDEDGDHDRDEDGKDGFIQHDGFISRGGDLLVATLTVAEAVKKATTLLHCKGFCFRGLRGDGPVEIFFKSKWDLQQSSKTSWTAFRKKRPFEPDDVIILKDCINLAAGDVCQIEGETSELWQCRSSDKSCSVKKRQHGDVWVEHDALPIEILILNTKYGARAGERYLVTGEAYGDWLLLQNGIRVPYSACADMPTAKNPTWKEVAVVSMQSEVKSSLLTAIGLAGSTKAWRSTLGTARSSPGSGRPSGSMRHAPPPHTTTAGSASRIRCSQCAITKVVDAFSKTQRKRAVALRRCRACVACRG